MREKRCTDAAHSAEYNNKKLLDKASSRRCMAAMQIERAQNHRAPKLTCQFVASKLAPYRVVDGVESKKPALSSFTMGQWWRGPVMARI